LEAASNRANSHPKGIFFRFSLEDVMLETLTMASGRTIHGSTAWPEGN